MANKSLHRLEYKGIPHAVPASVGRPEWERRDCAVVALSEALCIPYLKAHDFLGKQGRKNGGRTPDEVSQAAYQGAGLVLMEDFLFRNTLRTALKKLKAFGGRWILGRSGHLFAVIDGMIHDSELNSPRCLVDRVYYVWGFGNLDENDY